MTSLPLGHRDRTSATAHKPKPLEGSLFKVILPKGSLGRHELVCKGGFDCMAPSFWFIYGTPNATARPLF